MLLMNECFFSLCWLPSLSSRVATWDSSCLVCPYRTVWHHRCWGILLIIILWVCVFVCNALNSCEFVTLNGRLISSVWWCSTGHQELVYGGGRCHYSNCLLFARSRPFPPHPEVRTWWRWKVNKDPVTVKIIFLHSENGIGSLFWFLVRKWISLFTKMSDCGLNLECNILIWKKNKFMLFNNQNLSF